VHVNFMHTDWCTGRSTIVEALEGRVEVYLDGGVRQGTDVIIGRPVLCGLAVYQVSVWNGSFSCVCVSTFVHTNFGF